MAWIESARRQAQMAGAAFAPPGLLSSGVSRIVDGTFQIAMGKSSYDSYKARSIVLATGSTPRRLDLGHESNLFGSTLHSCAICDGPLYTSTHTVLVVGGGESALEAVALLSRRVKKVYLIHRRIQFTANNAMKRVGKFGNVEVLSPFRVIEWLSNANDAGQLRGAKLRGVSDTDEDAETKTLAVDGAFVMIGSHPNTDFLEGSGIKLDESGRVILESNNKGDGKFTTQTSVPGIFAAGEVVDGLYRQAVTAAGEGARAAMDVERWLQAHGKGGQGVGNIAASTAKMGVGLQAAEQRVAKEHRAASVGSRGDQTDRNEVEGEGGNKSGEEDCDLVQSSCITSLVSSHPVVVFSKPWCPYCRRALEILALNGVLESNPNMRVIDLAAHPRGRDVQGTLGKMTGRRTVPNVFVGGSSIGGGDETVALQNGGKLKGLLLKAGAVGS
uniref:Thioredoxin reductase n=1 Tax=Odontella aurita TaxID=265563 RepID=A0A7S4HWS1_9STRA|mmetsp:Transcript_16460/g.47298  ORF Transcript_16460/g.47298 Transcript_16460/m.47298 type:complete len:443 (+) Transcript_16460:177-1505(+)